MSLYGSVLGALYDATRNSPRPETLTISLSHLPPRSKIVHEADDDSVPARRDRVWSKGRYRELLRCRFARLRYGQSHYSDPEPQLSGYLQTRSNAI